MLDSRLVKTILLLTPAEQKELFLFSQFGYFIESDAPLKARQLLHHILEHIDKNPVNFQKEQLIQSLFPKSIAKDKENKLHQLMSDALKLVNFFISFKKSGLGSDFIQQGLFLARFLDERILLAENSEHIDSNLKKGKGKQKGHWHQNEVNHIRELLLERFKNGPLHTLHLYQQFQLDNEIYQSQSDDNKKQGDIHLNKVISSLDIYYLTSKSEYLCALILQKSYSSQEEQASIDSFLAYSKYVVTNEIRAEYPLLHLYSFLLDIFQKIYIGNIPIAVSEIDDFDALLKNNISLLEPDKGKEIYAHLRNCCTRLYNMTKDLEWVARLNRYYREHLESGYLWISVSLAQNIVLTGLRLGRLEDIDAFFDRYAGSPLIGSDYPEAVWNVLMANYLYSKKEITGRGDFSEIKNLLRDYYQKTVVLSHKDQDWYIRLNAYRVEMKVLLEENYFGLEEQADFYISTFQKLSFIHIDRRKANLTFFKILKKLFALQNAQRKKRADLASAIKKISQNEKPAEKEWLLKKFGEIMAHS